MGVFDFVVSVVDFVIDFFFFFFVVDFGFCVCGSVCIRGRKKMMRQRECVCFTDGEKREKRSEIRNY